MTSQEIASCLRNLTKKYASDISEVRRGDLAIANSENILHKLGFRSIQKTKSPPKKKIKKKSPNANKTQEAQSKTPFTSSIVIEPRGNEPKYLQNVDQVDDFLQQAKTLLKNRNTQTSKCHALKNKHERTIKNEGVQQQPKLLQKPTTNQNPIPQRTDITPNTKEIELMISIKPKDSKSHEMELSASLNHPTKQIENQMKISNKPTHEQAVDIDQHTKNKQRKPLPKPVQKTSMKDSGKKRDFTKQLNRFALVRLLDWFSLWQQKTSSWPQ